MVEGLHVEIVKPPAKEHPDKLNRLVLSVKNSSTKDYLLEISAKFYVSNSKSKWKEVPFARKQKSFATAKPNSSFCLTTSINIPVSAFEEYKYLKTEVEITVYEKRETTKKRVGRLTLVRTTVNITKQSAKKSTHIEIPYSRLRAGVINGLQRRPDYVLIEEDKHLIEVTETVKKVAPAVTSAWLVIDTSIDKMSVEKGWPEDLCTKPECIVKRWLSGVELQRLTVDGVRYTVKMPASILIIYKTGIRQHAGKAMSENEMIKQLAFRGYVEDIVERVLKEKPGDAQEALKILQEVKESKKALSDLKEEKEHKWMYVAVALVLAISLIGIVLWRR